MWAIQKVEEIVVAHGGTDAVAIAFAAVVAVVVVGAAVVVVLAAADGGGDDAAVPQLCTHMDEHSSSVQHQPEVVVRESGTLRSVADSPDIHWELGMPSCPLLPFYGLCSV